MSAEPANKDIFSFPLGAPIEHCCGETHFLDTNAYALLLGGAPSDAENRLRSRLFKGGCIEASICELTSLEIHSVLGQLARGTSGGVHICERKIESAEGYVPCPQKWAQNRRKGLRRLELERLRKSIKDAESGHGPIRLDVVTMDTADFVLGRAYLYRYGTSIRFGSHDAVIGAVAARHLGGEVRLVTSDKGLKAVLREIGRRYYDPLKDELWDP